MDRLLLQTVHVSRGDILFGKVSFTLFIEKLPDGYKTIVGEGGVQLSAGQKRRLMIARAILKNPKILILDEPLVSLDGEARRRTIEGLATLIGSRTVLTISHYQSEVPRVNKQMHVCDGKVTVRDLSGSTTCAARSDSGRATSTVSRSRTGTTSGTTGTRRARGT